MAISSLYGQIKLQFLIVKWSGTLFVSYRNRKFRTCSRWILIFGACSYIFADLRSFYEMCLLAFEILSEKATAKSLASFMGKLSYQVTIFLCTRFILFQTNDVTQLFNCFQKLQNEAICAIHDHHQKLKPSFYAFFFIIVFPGVHILMDFYKKVSLSEFITHFSVRMIISSMTINVFLILSILESFLRSANTNLCLHDTLNEHKLQKIRRTVGEIIFCCSIFDDIYGILILAIIASSSLYLLLDIYLITEFALNSIYVELDTNNAIPIAFTSIFTSLHIVTLLSCTSFCESIMMEVLMPYFNTLFQLK
jgi:hypothetical protein